MAWSLRHPAVDGAIVSYPWPDQIEPILAGAKLQMTGEDLEQINRAAKGAHRHRPPGSAAPTNRRWLSG